MNKVTRILLAIGLILAIAAPAFAEFKFSGFYRLIGYAEEKKALVGDGDSQQFIDQRFRAKLAYNLNDNVSVVYFAEIDTPWGEPGKAATGQGGQSYAWGGGSDGVNVETKNVYLDLKMGNTAAVLGIQTFADTFQGIVALDDMAAVSVTHKIGNTSLKAVYSKWDEDYATSNSATTTTTVASTDLENDTDATIDVDPHTHAATSTTTLSLNTAKAAPRSDWDDFDFYALEANQKFTDNFKAGAGVYFMDDNRTGDGKELWFYGLNADAAFGDFGINGFFVMQDGTNDETANDYDYSGWAASVKGTMKIANGDLGLRFIYFTEDDEEDENGAWQGSKGYYDFVAENQMQFLTDPYVMNDGKERYAQTDASERGYGLMGLVLSGNHKLPSDMYLKWGAGYYLAADDTAAIGVNGADVEREGDELGYELCARVGKKYFETVDVSLNASWADYGDFYENANGDDPDGTYKTYLMVNVPF